MVFKLRFLCGYKKRKCIVAVRRFFLNSVGVFTERINIAEDINSSQLRIFSFSDVVASFSYREQTLELIILHNVFNTFVRR